MAAAVLRRAAAQKLTNWRAPSGSHSMGCEPGRTMDCELGCTSVSVVAIAGKFNKRS